MEDWGAAFGALAEWYGFGPAEVSAMTLPVILAYVRRMTRGKGGGGPGDSGGSRVKSLAEAFANHQMRRQLNGHVG